MERFLSLWMIRFIRALFRELVVSWTGFGRGLPAGLAVTLCILALLMPFDEPVARWLGSLGGSEAWYAAELLSWFGDLPRAPLGLLLLGWLGATFLRRTDWKRLVVGCLLAGIVAGAAANVVRPIAGRARPNAEIGNGFHGPSLEYAYHSFPSAHTSAVFGVATAAGVCVPPVALPAVTFAAGVAWSRVVLGAHRPSDVWAGICLGTWVGLYCGVALRRVRSSMNPASLTPCGISRGEPPAP